ncbi:hypothetical protein HT031_001447 [Scenedesmus sp. PABB004]|nr:hypothetical protein HT031_001447 [Scenedesmus sp. PABB004]
MALLARAEDLLARGCAGDAAAAARKALGAGEARGADAAARALTCLIQAEFQGEERLTDLEAALGAAAAPLDLEGLPVTVMLLWGVVAVELQEAQAARALLGRYVAAHSDGRGLSREDALALSRLFAVQLLARQLHDFAAAAHWLEAGGAGLSTEQRELLLLELEEEEELLQEERLAEWAATHAADAAGDVRHPGGACEPEASLASVSSMAHAGSACAALQELGHAVGDAPDAPDAPPGDAPGDAPRACRSGSGSACTPPARGGSGSESVYTDARAGSCGSRADSYATAASSWPAAQAAAPSAAAATAAEVPAAPAAAGAAEAPGGSPFVTMTGLLAEAGDEHDDEADSASSSAAAAPGAPPAGARCGALAAAGRGSPGAGRDSPASAGAGARDQAAAGGAEAKARPGGCCAVAGSVAPPAGADAAPSWADWAAGAASSAWGSCAEQLSRLGLDGVPPAHVAAGAGLAAAAIAWAAAAAYRRRRARRWPRR